ncbi:MAG: hypothetical protein JSU07_12535 [Bacteroidetes bacterium]|nr:hypothetical protein [Bacteroidota bacterium]
MKSIIKSLLAISIIATTVNAQTTKTISGFNHIESVTSDGKYIYAADIGKELNPTAKDGDGKIIKLDLKGKIIDSTFSKETLNAPKGITIANGILYAADVDRLVALDIKSGKKLYEISFTDGISFLNDITVVDKTTLYISSTDKSKIYKVNLTAKTYSELITDKAISGTNGLFFDKKSNRLYVNGTGSDNKPNGIVGYVDLSNNKFTQLATIEGLFDGIWLNNNMLYTSNWVAFEKKGIIQTVDLKTNQVSEIKLKEPIAGPADFTILKNQIIIPEMMTGTIQFINLK